MFDFWTGAADLPVYGFLIRAFIVYVYVFLMLKILGQRTMNAINPIDFIFGVIIGDIIGEPLADGEIPLGGPFAAAALIASLHLALSIISLHIPRFRRVVEEEPRILMRNGKILKDQLRKAKMTTEAFLMDLRLMDAADLNEVDYAVLEANGQISVIKKSNYQSLTPNDMQKDALPKGYPTVLVDDGHIIEANVKKVGTLNWLRDQIIKHGYNNHSEVFLMTMDESGQIFISGKN